MPINLPNNLPAIDYLEQENIFVLDQLRSSQQDIRPLKIGVLNLMPLKIETETDLIRLLSNSPLQIELTLVRISDHESKNTSKEHMEQFYVTFDAIKEQKFDGFIITGAPVEMMPFEKVDYWEELQQILNWSRTNVTSVYHICWAAQAGLYHHYGIEKHQLSQKLSGVFEHEVCADQHPIFRGFDSTFYVPHSRNTTVLEEDILKHPDLSILSKSKDAGVYIIAGRGGREFYVTGHSEYTANTLHNEYQRDLAKGLSIEMPQNYYKEDNPALGPMVRWRAHANLIYVNWLNYFVYQQTPYNIDEIK